MLYLLFIASIAWGGYQKIEHQCQICGKSVYVVVNVKDDDYRFHDDMGFYSLDDWRQRQLVESIPDSLFETALSINFSRAIMVCEACKLKYGNDIALISIIADSLWNSFIQKSNAENNKLKKHYDECRRIDALGILEKQIQELKSKQEMLEK